MQLNLRTLGVIAIWCTLATALFSFFNTKSNPNTAGKLRQGAQVELKRDLSGHYRAEAVINGVKTPVLVDTGATDVSISRRLANELGIQSNAAARTQPAN